MSKINIIGSSTLFQVSVNVSSFSVQVDLYSDWKEWAQAANGANLKFLQAFRTVGGDTIGAGLDVGDYYFIFNDNGWRVRSWEGDHELIVNGNLYPEDSTNPIFSQTSGPYTVPIFLERSQLTQTAEVSVGSGLDAEQNEKLHEIWTLQALNSAASVVTTQSTIDAGASISLKITGDPESSITVSRV